MSPGFGDMGYHDPSPFLSFIPIPTNLTNPKRVVFLNAVKDPRLSLPLLFVMQTHRNSRVPHPQRVSVFTLRAGYLAPRRPISIEQRSS
jgi:hypothetical protein